MNLSVVIGFRDWGLDRLALALRAHRQSTFADRLEVVVSDYGSREGAAVEAVATENGAVYARTDVDGPWSRARALNAGLVRATGEILITTDSDLLFTPAVCETAYVRLMADPRSVQLLQCRDLGERHVPGTIETFDWDEFERSSAFRPRWGMGGMIAFHRAAFDASGGYDERMEIYGGEDIDFAKRLRRLGLRQSWIDDRRARIFHVWHPSSRTAADATPEGVAAIARNSQIHMEDRTVVRNARRSWGAPVATVAIATRDRAHLIGECLYSVLSQTVENIEVLVLDDGSQDGTRDAVAAVGDERVRYLREDEPGGVARARNRLVAEASAPYVVVHDDDDLMLPWRIEAQFDALVEGTHGTYGGWVNFDDETGELVIKRGKAYSRDAVLYTGAVLLHPTLMLRRDVLAEMPYNELLLAGSDYNLVLRLAGAGARLEHTGEFHILRRQHRDNLTLKMPAHQQQSARRSTNLFRRQLTRAEEDAARRAARALPELQCAGPDSPGRRIAPCLPDALTRRAAAFDAGDPAIGARVEAALGDAGLTAEERYVVDTDGALVKQGLLARGVRWRDVHRLRRAGLEFEIESDPTEAGAPGVEEELAASVRDAGGGFAALTYCAASSPAASAVWQRPDRRRDLLNIGAEQYVASVELFGDLDAAVEAICNGDATPAGAHALLIDLSALAGS